MKRKDEALVALALLLLLFGVSRLGGGSSSSAPGSSSPGAIPRTPIEGNVCNELGWIWKRKGGGLWCSPKWWPF